MSTTITPGRFISHAKNIAAYLGRSERATYHLLEAGKVPGARKLGGTWTLDTEAFAAGFVALPEVGQRSITS